MEKKGFSLIELIISISLIAGIAILSVFVFIKRDDKKITFTNTEQTILEACQLFVDVEYDLDGGNFKHQLNLGAQGVQISLNKLLSEGLIDEKVIDSLYEELKKQDSNIAKEDIGKYYILVLNGSFDEEYKEDPCNGMLTYYLSWKNDFADSEQDLYLCGNLPNGDISATVEASIVEKNDYDKYVDYDIYDEYDYMFKLTDEQGNIINNIDGKYKLNYGEKYYMTFSDAAVDYNGEYFNFWSFNDDNNYIFITLNDVADYKNGKNVNVEYDLSNYIQGVRPPYSLKNLKDELLNNAFKNAQSASENLNYNQKSPGTVDDSGYYYDNDDDGKTYFYRGDVNNNYVKFAGYLWRIIRINGDGTIRLILDDDIGSSNWSDIDTDETQLSFSNSNIKQLLNEWYSSNLEEYEYLIAKTTYCNDTSKGSSNYKVYNRLANSNNSVTPTFTCTGDFEYGGEYDLKIGLITADEMVYAGAHFGSFNTDYYLEYKKAYWTMTPYSFTSSNLSVFSSDTDEKKLTEIESYEEEKCEEYEEWIDDGDGTIINSGQTCEIVPGGYTYNYTGVTGNIFSSTPINISSRTILEYNGDTSIVVRPVINLAKNVKYIFPGDGTYGKPYEIETNRDYLDYWHVTEEVFKK